MQIFLWRADRARRIRRKPGVRTVLRQVKPYLINFPHRSEIYILRRPHADIEDCINHEVLHIVMGRIGERQASHQMDNFIKQWSLDYNGWIRRVCWEVYVSA
jgi:hypothetical protein